MHPRGCTSYPWFSAFPCSLLVIRLIQKGRLDIAYCWLWLCIGIMAPLIVIKIRLAAVVSDLIGALSP